MELANSPIIYRNKQRLAPWFLYTLLMLGWMYLAITDGRLYMYGLIFIPLQPLLMLLQKSTSKVELTVDSVSYKELFTKKITLRAENIRKVEVKEMKQWHRNLFNTAQYTIVVSYNKYDDLSIQTDHQEVINWFSQNVSRS